MNKQKWETTVVAVLPGKFTVGVAWLVSRTNRSEVGGNCRAFLVTLRLVILFQNKRL